MFTSLKKKLMVIKYSQYLVNLPNTYAYPIFTTFEFYLIKLEHSNPQKGMKMEEILTLLSILTLDLTFF